MTLCCIVRKTLKSLWAACASLDLPAAARAEARRDRLGLPGDDPGIDRCVDEAVAWVCRAQDNSTSNDGGVARHYSLVSGWSSSYPETTGYIIPTMLEVARRKGDEQLRRRARRMLDWLVSIQLPCGGFQGGNLDAKTVVPVTFNTGQILLGLAAGVEEFGEGYRTPMRRAADWLAATQDDDGCWRKHCSPFTMPGDKVYDTHVAWGLLEAARLAPDAIYASTALANVRWALTHQYENGWFDCCCLTDGARPLTHTLGYALRGILEAYRFSGDEEFLAAARSTADGLLGAMHEDGFLAGRLWPDWEDAARWACLTGTVQIAHCWLLLYDITGEACYRDAALVANGYVRRTMGVSGPPETRGGVKGSFPVNGGYGTYEYLNWACKFFIDSNLAQKDVRQREEAADDK